MIIFSTYSQMEYENIFMVSIATLNLLGSQSQFNKVNIYSIRLKRIKLL